MSSSPSIYKFQPYFTSSSIDLIPITPGYVIFTSKGEIYTDTDPTTRTAYQQYITVSSYAELLELAAENTSNAWLVKRPNVLYCVADTNRLYRWNGSSFVSITGNTNEYMTDTEVENMIGRIFA